MRADLFHRSSEIRLMPTAAFDERYACSIYVHSLDPSRFLLICERPKLQALHLPHRCWTFVASGFNPPHEAKPSLKSKGFHEMRAWIEGRLS